MKLLSAALLMVACAITSPSQTFAAPDPLPGHVDFGKFTAPESGGDFVEISVSSSLISLASRLVEKEEPQAAELLKRVLGVRVHVIGVDSKNRSEITQRVRDVVTQLDGKGWQKLVTAQKKNEDVNIFLKMAEDETVQGLAVVVMESEKQAVFINVVGDIRPEHLSMLGDRLHIEQLKKTGAAADSPKHEAQSSKPSNKSVTLEHSEG